VVNVALHELSTQDERQLSGLFQGKGYDLLVRCIEAEYLYEAHNLKVGIVDLAFEPDAKLDREMLVKAARLKVALDVLQEFASENKIHYDIVLES